MPTAQNSRLAPESEPKIFLNLERGGHRRPKRVKAHLKTNIPQQFADGNSKMMDRSLRAVESKAVFLDLLRWPGSSQHSIMYSGYTDGSTTTSRIWILREFSDYEWSCLVSLLTSRFFNFFAQSCVNSGPLGTVFVSAAMVLGPSLSPLIHRRNCASSPSTL